MEQIRSILGLEVFEGRITDKFERAFIKCIRRVGERILDINKDIRVEGEMSALEKRETIVCGEEDKVYGKALRLLAKLRPEYKKNLLRSRRDAGQVSDLLKKKMRLAIWVGGGNEIPVRELNEAMLKKFLKRKGYTYRRKSGEMGWYRRGTFVGENLFEALEHLEGLEAVDRSRLSISF